MEEKRQMALAVSMKQRGKLGLGMAQEKTANV